jgi:hypothetical protein
MNMYKKICNTIKTLNYKRLNNAKINFYKVMTVYTYYGV